MKLLKIIGIKMKKNKYLAFAALMIIGSNVQAGDHYGRLVKVQNLNPNNFDVIITPSYYQSGWYKRSDGSLEYEVAGHGTNLNNIKEDMSIVIPWESWNLDPLKIQVFKKGTHELVSQVNIKDKNANIVFEFNARNNFKLRPEDRYICRSFNDCPPNPYFFSKIAEYYQHHKGYADSMSFGDEVDVNINLVINEDGSITPHATQLGGGQKKI